MFFYYRGMGNERIDKALSDLIDSLSRSHIQKLLKDGMVTVNQTAVKANCRLKCDDEIKVMLPPAASPDILPENIPLDILYEDDDVLVVNKPKGMVVHPAAGHLDGTLVNAVMYHCQGNLSGINGIMRPGIVHRIDKDTTGSVIICKNDFSHNHIAAQLKEHSVVRRYHAICYGVPQNPTGTINAPIGRHPTDRKKMAINEKNGEKQPLPHYQVLSKLSWLFLYRMPPGNRTYPSNPESIWRIWVIRFSGMPYTDRRTAHTEIWKGRRSMPKFLDSVIR